MKKFTNVDGELVEIPVKLLEKLTGWIEDSDERFKTLEGVSNKMADALKAKVDVSGVLELMTKEGKRNAEHTIDFSSGGSSSTDFYQKLFGGSGLRAAPGGEGWKSFHDFADQLARRVNSDGIEKALSSGLPSDGGALIPEEFASEIFNIALEEAVTLSRVRSYGMKSDTKKIPGVVIGDHSTNLFGGLIAYWTGEGSELTEANPEYRSIELKASKLTVFGKASSEWDQDATGGREGLKLMMGQALGWYLDDAFINGTGVGRPLGVMNSPCLIEVAKGGTQSADTVTYDNLVGMLSRLHPASLKNAVWLAHPTCLPQLMLVAGGVEMTGPLGATGTHEAHAMAVAPHLNPDGSMNFLTRPMYLSEKMQPLGDKGDILLADFSQYGVGMRKDLRLEASKDLYFATDEIAYRGIIRADGQPLWDDVLTLKDGATTVSPFITLAERT